MRLAHLRCVLFGHCWSYLTYFGKELPTVLVLAGSLKFRKCQRCGLWETQ